MVDVNEINPKELASTLTEYKRLLGDRESLQAKIEAVESRLLELGWPVPGKQQPHMAALKRKEHATGRAEAKKLGITYSQLRLERTAEKLNVSVRQLEMMRAEWRTEAARARLSYSAWKLKEAKRLKTGINAVEGFLVAERLKRN